MAGSEKLRPFIFALIHGAKATSICSIVLTMPFIRFLFAKPTTPT